MAVLRAELQQNIRHQAGDDNRITGAADAHESPRQCRLQTYTIFTHLSRDGPHIRQFRQGFFENHRQVFRQKTCQNKYMTTELRRKRLVLRHAIAPHLLLQLSRHLLTPGEEGAWAGRIIITKYFSWPAGEKR